MANLSKTLRTNFYQNQSTFTEFIYAQKYFGVFLCSSSVCSYCQVSTGIRKEVMCSGQSVFLSARLVKSYEWILRVAWLEDQVIRFWWRCDDPVPYIASVFHTRNAFSMG